MKMVEMFGCTVAFGFIVMAVIITSVLYSLPPWPIFGVALILVALCCFAAGTILQHIFE